MQTSKKRIIAKILMKTKNKMMKTMVVVIKTLQRSKMMTQKMATIKVKFMENFDKESVNDIDWNME
jgi:hypothetical protein